MGMHYESYQPTISGHSFFESIHRIDMTGFMNVCHFAISQVFVQVAEDAMSYGVEAEAMHFVLSGRLWYHHGKNEGSPDIVGLGAWFAEMVVWLQWIHRGRLVAQTPCELLRLDAKTFREIMSQTVVLDHCRTYARRFMAALAEQEHPSDLWKEPKSAFGLQDLGRNRATLDLRNF
mmetsp:Transcript_78700/g.197724  ORF Transcript_78700/g.197724 Transcript_78700/m.197724 type:complete len:176 (+) Transcript_78700:1-528(+)